MCNDLALDNDAITVPFVTSISTFTEDDVDVNTGNHRVKVWLRQDDREFYVWLRLSRLLEGKGPFMFDRVKFTWKAPQD